MPNFIGLWYGLVVLVWTFALTLNVCIVFVRNISIKDLIQGSHRGWKDSEKKSLKIPWIFQFEDFFYEILGKWLKYRRSYHLKLENYIFWVFWYVYQWSRRVDSHFRTLPYRYAIVREIVAFANFTIKFYFALNNNRFFSKMSKNKCIFLPNGSPRSHTSLGSNNLRVIIEMPLFPMWQTYWHWYYGWQCPKIAHEIEDEKRKAQVRNDNDWMSA